MCIEDHTKLGDGWVRQIRDQMVLVSASLRDRGAIAVLITTAFACFAAEQWSMQLRLPPHGLAPLWPFSGVAIGIVLISTGAYKRAAIAGAILALLAFNPSLGQSAGEGMNFIVGHALELALILLIVKRVAALPFEIRRFRDLVVLFGATLVAAALSGVVVAFDLRPRNWTDLS